MVPRECQEAGQSQGEWGYKTCFCRFTYISCKCYVKLVHAVDATAVICNTSPTLSCRPDDMEMCSLKVLQPEGSPSRTLLKLMGERGCTTGHLIDCLQTMGNCEALQCLKPPGTLQYPHRVDICSVLNLFQKRSFCCAGLQILVQPQSVAIMPGHNLRLSCYAVGKSPVQYQWFKGKDEVSSSLLN